MTHPLDVLAAVEEGSIELRERIERGRAEVRALEAQGGEIAARLRSLALRYDRARRPRHLAPVDGGVGPRARVSDGPPSAEAREDATAARSLEIYGLTARRR